MDRLPTDVWRTIYEFDGTYLEYLRKSVLPELKEETYIRYCQLYAHHATDFGFIVPFCWGMFGYISDFSEDEEDTDEDEF